LKFGEQFSLFEKRPNHREHAKRLPVAGQSTDESYPLFLQKTIYRKAQRWRMFYFIASVK